MNDKSAYQCNLFLKTIDDTLNVLYAMFDEHFVTYYCLETKQLKIFDKDMNELKFDIVKL
ncbi:MAG: hypothetical protein PHN69_08130 [Candidatus Pacebacteria bacterium]|nr:hypothetical protein [Candidatus Paceibacterota bacterium]